VAARFPILATRQPMAAVRLEESHGMSLLMFATDPNQVLVVTDTLATHPTGEPYLLVSKCSIVPHLEIAVAYTGVAQVGQRWAHQLQTAVLARNIDLLDQHVPGALRKVTTDVIDEFGDLPGSSTVYHFGYSEEKEAYVGIAYRSEKDFESDPIPYGFGVKPVPVGEFSAPNDLDGLVALGKQIRAEQDAGPQESRIYIGGEFWMTVLANRTIQVSKLFRFDDFEEQWLQMNASLQ
jgi:hypothetical protein